MEDKTLKDILSKALEMEEKGYEFYKKVARESSNKITNTTFDFLANNELDHIENIKKFYAGLEEKGEFPAVDFEELKNKRAKNLNIFNKSIEELKKQAEPSNTDEKACEFGMKFEKNGYKYYESALKDSDNERLNEFLKFLLEEENRHYEQIMELHTYLTDSDNWNLYEEDSFPQGG